MLWKDVELRLTPKTIVVIYVLLGILWAVASAWYPSLIFTDHVKLQRIQIYNSWIFIVSTAVILYFLIYRSEAVILRRKESLYRVNRALKAFSECNQALVRARDELQLMREICQTMVQVGGYKLAWVGIAENDPEKSIRPVAQFGDEGGYLDRLRLSWSNTDLGRGPTGTAIRTGVTSVVQNIEYDPRWILWKNEALTHGFAASISLPLSDGNRPFGALVIFAAEKGAFDREEVKLLEELASDLSFGISTLRMNVERKQVERERKLLSLVVEQSMEGIMLFDGDGMVQYANPAMEKITGRGAGRLIGSNISSRGPESGFDNEFYRVIWETLSRGEAHTGHFIQRGADGRIHEMDSTIWSISDSNGVVSNYAAMVRDVTNEVQLERQLRQAQRMEAIATLAGGIAHDFNNNLASIITCTELALEDLPEESPTRELLDVVLKSGYRGKNLVRQILTFSCRYEEERQPVQVDLIVQECLSLLRPSLSSAIEIHCSVDERLGMVMADPTQVHQIIMNLCTNAGHAMREKGGRLEIVLVNEDLAEPPREFPDLAAGPYLRITVRDTGHGMDSTTMERIFDPFFTTKSHEGTGLGLSVIHGIVKNHGGGIKVESLPGHGATFHIYLPRIDGPAPVVRPASPGSSLAGNRERILLVDDEEDVVMAGKKMLERLGYQVMTGRSGEEALALYHAEKGNFDLVITDQVMPGMSGMELARRLTGMRPGLPVILCTGCGHNQEGIMSEQARREAGVREMALKPFNKSEMAGLIRRIIEECSGGGEGAWQTSS